MEQQQAIELALAGHNIFLTGKAGTGKTYTLNKIINILKEKKRVAVTASTGIAATLLDGQTLHAWSGTGIKESLIIDDLYKIARNYFLRERILRTNVLVIDEISMLKGVKFDVIDEVCKFVKRNDRPFGGIQVIVSGDFFQLPPIEQAKEKDYCFKAQSWINANFKICYLKKIYRQSDDTFIDLLNNIRKNDVSFEQIEILKDLSKKEKDDKATHLFCKKVNVNIINARELNSIDEEPYIFRMEGEGNEYAVKILKKNCLAPETLILKKGAKVMFVKNDFDRNIVNGTQGEIVDFDTYRQYDKNGEIVAEWDDIPYVKIFNEDRIEPAFYTSWKLEEFNPKTKQDEIKAQITQIPLRLSWALTIHKAQGSTFNYINLDLIDVFEKGMGYVALSRATSLAGIYLSGFNEMALKVDDYIIKKDLEFQKKSEELQYA